jgi:hypothetical protein
MAFGIGPRVKDLQRDQFVAAFFEEALELRDGVLRLLLVPTGGNDGIGRNGVDANIGGGLVDPITQGVRGTANF